MYFLGAGHLGVAQPVFLLHFCLGVQSSLGSAGLASVSSLTPAPLEGLLSYMWMLQSLCLLSGTRVPLYFQKLLSPRSTPAPGGRAHTHREMQSYKQEYYPVVKAFVTQTNSCSRWEGIDTQGNVFIQRHNIPGNGNKRGPFWRLTTTSSFTLRLQLLQYHRTT